MTDNSARRASFLLRRVLVHKNMQIDKALASFGLSIAFWPVLLTIAKNPGLSTHALAVNCFITDQSCGQLIAKLADKGLIERKPGPGKAILHELTEAGETLLERADPILNKAVSAFFSPLEPEETVLLVNMFERLLGDQTVSGK